MAASADAAGKLSDDDELSTSFKRIGYIGDLRFCFRSIQHRQNQDGAYRSAVSGRKLRLLIKSLCLTPSDVMFVFLLAVAKLTAQARPAVSAAIAR